jgi:hypothetical protein
VSDAGQASVGNPDEDSALDEKPSEFFSSMAGTGGYHDGQAIVPEGDHYKCWCSCGEWQIEAPTEAEGLHLARVHTGSVPA